MQEPKTKQQTKKTYVHIHLVSSRFHYSHLKVKKKANKCEIIKLKMRVRNCLVIS